MLKALQLALIGLLVALLGACSKPPASAAGGKSKSSGDGDDIGTGGAGGCDASDDEADDDDDDDDDEVELHLMAGMTYADVKDIFETNCVSCHSEGGSDGVELHTYSKAKKHAEDALASIEDGSMPQGGSPLDDTDIEAIQAWIDDGLEEGDDDDGAKKSSGSSKCGGGGGGDTDGTTDDSAIDAQHFEAVLNPPERQACHDKGKLFWHKAKDDHPKGYCIDVDKADFACDREGVLAAFGGSGEVKAELDAREAKGWTYDQCGVHAGGKPAVVMRCIGSQDACKELKDADPKQVSVSSWGMTTGPALDGLDPLD